MLAPWSDVDASDWALFLDIDGTLLEFQPHPEQVRADSELGELLRHLSHRLEGAMALVSGRAIADIDRIFAPQEFSAAGGHGSEIRLAGEPMINPALPTLPAAVVSHGQALVDANPGLSLEPKRHGLALHYRGAAHAGQQVISWIHAQSEQLGGEFCALNGNLVCELLPTGVDKGAAIRHVMGCERFRRRKPIFIGDDTTDEFGFRAANAHGGISIRIGGDERSAATASLASVAELRRWLAKTLLN